MVGYAISASSDTSVEHILITVYDEDDFAFIDGGCGCAVYKYSRVSGKIVKLDESPTHINLPGGVIYEISRFLMREEIEHSFPVAVSWRRPEFSGLEITSVEFQNMWPAVMIFKNGISAAYVNVTEQFFSGRSRLLDVSFTCDILNLLMFKLGVYADVPFCPCVDTVFCDVRVIRILKRIFGRSTFEKALSDADLKKLLKHSSEKLAYHKSSVKGKIKKYRCRIQEAADNASFTQRLTHIKRKTLDTCMAIVKSYSESKSGDVMEHLGECIRDSIDEIRQMGDELVSRYLIDSRADISYLTLNDLLCAFAFADDKMDLKSVVRTHRSKNAVAKKHEAPKAVLPCGEFVFQ